MSCDDYFSDISEQSKEFVDDIMDKIESLLSSNDIPFSKNKKGTEIRINKSDSNLDKDDVNKLIKKSLDIPKPVLSLLVVVKSTKKIIYIRQTKK